MDNNIYNHIDKCIYTNIYIHIVYNKKIFLFKAKNSILTLIVLTV